MTIAACGLATVIASAQGVQTGTLQGTATDTQGGVLPGVTVSVESTALQGVRTTVTDDNGVYVLRGLPAGAYTIKFDLSGFQPVSQKAEVRVGSPSQVDASLGVAGQAENITVSANPIEAVVTSTASTANFKYNEIQTLPSGRNPQAIAQLSPGLTTNTPNAGQITISGAFAYDNVFLVDGVDVNDNLFGTQNNLFIEDAIEETQILTSGISAEYGRFSGGVVNVVTKSGGDLFSGTFRANLANDSWQKRSPFEESRGIQKSDKVNPVYEGTAGGPILRQRLWFFGAGRYLNTENLQTLNQTGLPFTGTNTEKRGQIKLTTTVANNHTFAGTYTRVARDTIRVALGQSGDPRVIEHPNFPNDGWILNYRGVLSPRLFADVRASRKTFGFRNSGGLGTAITDSPFLTLASPTVHYNAPYFDATDPEDRNNYQVAGSLSYFLSTKGTGSHDVKGGFEVFNSTRTGGNSQSPTSYVFDADYVGTLTNPTLDSSGRFIPIFTPGETLLENYIATRGAQVDTRTLSFYLQDTWKASRHLSIDAGFRYEKVDGEATGGLTTVDTSAIVPRLAASYDIKGDGRLVAQATYAWYAGKYSESQFAQNSTVGNPTFILSIYEGPEGQGLDFAPGLNPANYSIIDGQFPLANIKVASGISSPITKEVTLSLGAAIGKGFVKGTFINRNASNFVEDFINLTTGTTTVTEGGVDFGTFNNTVFDNSDIPTRDYRALQFQGRYQVFSMLGLYANYTAQLKNDGNFEGEGVNTPGSSSIFGDYPEAFNEARNYPTGRLNDFQRHKIRAWAVYTQKLGRFGNIDIAPLYKYDSPTTFSLQAASVPLSAIQQGLLAPYDSRPANQTLFFGERGSEFFAAAHLMDLGINYEVPVYRTLKPYVKFDLFNVFNNKKLLQWNTTIRPDPASALDSLGLATGYIRGATFGQATANVSYPAAYRWQVAFGFRF